MKPPLFTLLIPTRNRAKYLSAGIGFFLNSDRDDFEVIVSDASDDHKDCLDELSPWLSDDRLKILDNTVATTGKLSSMTQNWSSALDQASARWVTIIGDDDVCDPAVTEFLEHFERVAQDTYGVTWHRAHFDIGLDIAREAKIPMGSKIMLAAGKESVLRQAQWPNDKRPPSSLCSPYHGAVRLDVLKKLKEVSQGSWFRYKIPDYDLGWSVALNLSKFAICERPFSITGVSPESNSYSVRNEEKRAEYLQNWNRESRSIDGWGETNDPFLFTFPMVVLGFRNAFCRANNLESSVILQNLVTTLKNSVQNQENEVSFEHHRRALEKYLMANFKQDFGVTTLSRQVRPEHPMAGLIGDVLAAPNVLFAGDICRFAEIAFGIVRPVNYLFSQSN